ncbi:MAG: phytoene desaturase [Chloroflexaceae bacterium]|nr:phytoene desaturase [Chloroflexaceae bacterium]
MSNPFVIVGGGLGGLSTAIHLALQQRSVVLLEKNERLGGKMNIVQEAGYTFDTGPSLLTMPWILRDLFAAAGRNLEDTLELIPLDPICRYIWPDQTQFDFWQNLPGLVQAIDRLNPADVTGLFRFLAYVAPIYQTVADVFLLQPFDGIGDLLTPRLLRDGWRIDAFRTMDQSVQQYFQSPYLRQIFNRYATYNGSSPYLTPATFNVIAYIELVEGGWHVRGGIYRLAQALQQLAENLGVDIRTSSEVCEIRLHRGRACGVTLAGGQQIQSEAVVVNADPRYAYEQLLPGQDTQTRRLQQLEPSCSGFILLLGINRSYKQLQHHNIFFSQDYRTEFEAIFARGVPAPDPTVYVCSTSVTDQGHAPPGHMNLFVLVNAPSLNERYRWEREKEGYRQTIIRKLERMGLSDLSQHIVYEQIITPLDLWQRYHAAAGAIYGLASNNPFVAFLRPPLRARGIKQLYFVGGGTHPGGGIPLVLLSGQSVARRIAIDMPFSVRLRS